MEVERLTPKQEYARRYYQANKEAIREAQKTRYHMLNLDKVRQKRGPKPKPRPEVDQNQPQRIRPRTSPLWDNPAPEEQ